MPEVDGFPVSFSGPTSLGGVASVDATSGTGDFVGINVAPVAATSLAVPDGYVPGAALAGTATFANQSFASS